MGPLQYGWCLSKKGKFGHIHTGKMPREHEDSQGEKPGTGLLLRAFRKNQPCGHLDFKLLVFRTAS